LEYIYKTNLEPQFLHLSHPYTEPQFGR